MTALVGGAGGVGNSKVAIAAPTATTPQIAAIAISGRDDRGSIDSGGTSRSPVGVPASDGRAPERPTLGGNPGALTGGTLGVAGVAGGSLLRSGEPSARVPAGV
jgi:hypothetical protein